jgi:uncharacterized membrane protein
MQTPASISRHPVHPMLVVVPVGLWVFSLFCDLLYLGGAEAEIVLYSLSSTACGSSRSYSLLTTA